MKSDDIHYTTELDRDYAKALQKVCDGESLAKLLNEWDYWLDDPVKKLTAEDWDRIKPLIDDCRNEGIEPEEKHGTVLALLMPERIIKVSFAAHHFGVPWGCAYIRMKEEGEINF